MEQKNLLLAIVLSVGILIGFQFLFEKLRPPVPPPSPAVPTRTAPATPSPGTAAPGVTPGGPGTTAPATGTAAAPGVETREQAIAEQPRVRINTPRLHGSVALTGGRIDDLTLATYHETVDPKSPEVVLLDPAGTKEPYFAEFGWVAGNPGTKVPAPDTKWTATGGPLTPTAPVTLTWDNGAGLMFTRTIAIDENYMFTVRDAVKNTGTAPVSLSSYGLISRTGTPQVGGYYILHEGLIGELGGSLREVTYSSLDPAKPVEYESTGGWLGFTDKYWLTPLIKIIFFPLANKSYQAMSKMKLLQPEMQKIRERFPEDKARQQQEIMAMYKRVGANPLAGCLPIVIQIPVFFSLYKVLFVTIEMRHAPFFGWIHDLSAPDPTTFINLFGLLPFDPPAAVAHFVAIGAWPLLMGVTMYLQQKLNPQPVDPVQARMFMLLPIVFTYMLSAFPAGLVIYWAWNNLLSIAQQWAIMHRAGAA